MNTRPRAIAISISAIIALLCLTKAQAITNNQDFSAATSFDHSAGIAVDTNLGDIGFINTIPSTDGHGDDIVAVSNDGHGAIITNQDHTYRTYRGLEFGKAPQAQISSNINNDQLSDLITLLPAERTDSKEWRYAKIVEVGSDYIVTDNMLRKNILSQTVLIAPNGNQYQVRNNTGPTDSAPRNAIYLAKELLPTPSDTIGDLHTVFHVNEYATYLLPTKAISHNPQVIVDQNKGEYVFERSSCTPYIPRTIDTITSIGIGNANNDSKPDLFIITHKTEEWHASNVSVQYNEDGHVATMLINVPQSDIGERAVAGSYVAFPGNPDRLFTLRVVNNTQIAIDIPLPESGVGLAQVQAALLPGDRFWTTINTDESKTSLIYFGNNSGCFTYTGIMAGNVLESSYGQVLLPNADSPSESSRSVITDINANYLPINSLKDRHIQIGDANYTIEANNQSQLFLTATDGDIRDQTPDLLHSRRSTQYQVQALNPQPTISEEAMTISAVKNVPNAIVQLTGSFSLTNQQPIVVADTDHDGQIELLYLNNQHIFLKKQ